MKYKRGYYDMFVNTCAKWPANIAVRSYNDGKYDTYTYSELYGGSEYISQILQQLQCSKGVIGIVSNRNVLIPCIIAAAHKCSTAFMFLNPSNVIDSVINSMKFRVVIVIENICKNINKKEDKTIKIFNLTLNFYVYSENNFHVNQHSFITTTSGSTGDPKHVLVPLQCIQPNVDDLTKLFRINQHDVIYFSTPLTFDPSMIEILLACKNGACLLIAPDQADILFPDNKQYSVTFWQTTPSKFFQFPYSVITNKILAAQSSLKVLAFGGESLNGVKRLRELKSKENKTKIFTLYGVTEMSCWACVAELDLDKLKNDNDIPLGNCLSGTNIELYPNCEDRTLRDIVLTSKSRNCVVLNKDKPNEKQVTLKQVYTGDIVEFKYESIYYRGRRDDVIKRFGYKINLRSIETTVMQCPRVHSCSCIWLPTPMLLVVYFSSEKVNSEELTQFLKSRVDHSYLPDKVLRVKQWPTNEHGKTSKKILMNMFENSIHNNVTKETFRSAFMKELRISLDNALTYDDVKDKDFLAIGGTSFLAVSLCNRLNLDYQEISKMVLPQLLSSKLTIGKILRIAHKAEIINSRTNRFKDCVKRSGSSIEHFVSHKRSLKEESDASIPFTILISHKWDYDTGKCVDATPAILEASNNECNYVTVGSHSGKVVSLLASTGEVLGVIDLNSRIEAPVFCYNSMNEVPIGVVGTYDGTVACFTLDKCTMLWQCDVGSMIKSKAIGFSDYIYVASYDGKLRAIDVENGRIRFIVKIANQPISADLALARFSIVMASLSGICACFDARIKMTVWREMLGSPVFASPVVYGNDNFVMFTEVNGIIHSFTVDRGVKLWKYDQTKGNIFSAIHVKQYDDEHIWQMTFGCHDSHVYSIEVTKDSANLLWSQELEAPIYATPTSIHDDVIVTASTQGQLTFLNRNNGKILYQYKLPGETFSSPIVLKNDIFIGCRNDKLYAMTYSSQP